MYESKRSPVARSVISSVVVVLVLGLTPVAFAGHGHGNGGGGNGGGGGGSSSGSLSLVMVSDANGDGLANWGDTVTFDVTTDVAEPHVDLVCSQNNTVVYGATTGFYDDYPWPWTENMTLSSQMWTGGDASCEATLYYFSGSDQVRLGTVSFTAYA